MSSIGTAPDWADVINEHAADPRTARRLIGQLVAVEVAALAFCRLLERWRRGDAAPSTPGRRDRLVRALAAGRAYELVRSQRLAGTREPLEARGEVEVDRADDGQLDGRLLAHTSTTTGRIIGRRRVRS